MLIKKLPGRVITLVSPVPVPVPDPDPDPPPPLFGGHVQGHVGQQD